MDNNELIKSVAEAILTQLQIDNKELCDGIFQNKEEKLIPVGVSNHHVHLSEDDFAKLFGPDAQLTKIKDLSQPGQFACEERVTLVGPKGVIENVRILGPIRNQTQVELSLSDCVKLGLKASIRDSSDLAGSPGLSLVGSKDALTIDEGVIVAARHIHMHTNDAKFFDLKDGDRVSVKVSGTRGLIFNEVLIRVSGKYKLEMHIDFDEANAANISNNSMVEITKP